MRHVISSYQDGFTMIEFCSNCGQEGLALFMEPSCNWVASMACNDCGFVYCQCESIRLKFKKAVDNQNLRN